MKKKIISAILMAALVTPALSGCGLGIAKTGDACTTESPAMISPEYNESPCS